MVTHVYVYAIEPFLPVSNLQFEVTVTSYHDSVAGFWPTIIFVSVWSDDVDGCSIINGSP